MSYPALITDPVQQQFKQRLKLVRKAIAERVSHAPKNQQRPLTGRLWCAWINKNILNQDSHH